MRPMLRGDVICAAFQTGAIVRRDEVKVGDVDMRLIPVDKRDVVRGHADVTRVVGVAMGDACLTSD